MPEGWPGTEVGWGIDARFQGRGYAVEAAAASMDWAVETFGWTDIIHCIAPNNHPSQGVARKLGAVNRGPGRLPEPFADAVIDLWGQTAADWAANPLSRLCALCPCKRRCARFILVGSGIGKSLGKLLGR